VTLEQVQQERQSAQTIHDIVNATRAIAAGRMHDAQQALLGARRYQAVIMRAAEIALADLEVEPPHLEGRRTALLVMTAEQPLCGSLNEKVLTLAERRRHELGQEGRVDLLVIGERGLRLLAAHNIVPTGGEPAATSLSGLRDVVKRVASTLNARYSTGNVSTVRVIYSRYVSISEQVPTEDVILPPDFSALRQTASSRRGRYYHYLPTAALLEGILAEYAFITLYRIATEAYTSEQAARLVAMDAATRNTEHLLDDLQALEQRERQGQITRQVLELIGARFAAHTPAGRTSAPTR
jgi:F-type H+-transporting ATPase subunit gamma